MNRQTFLRAILMGKNPEIVTSRDQAMASWAMTHEPLLSPSTFAATGMHLNHFCVGSDPEFCFRDNDGNRIEAASCGLRVGLAAGADQNERLVELRPWPSPSVVEHVAGILTELRWLYRVYNAQAGAFLWRAGAYFAGDGMGGHVHFGRKRPTRTEEVAALDGLARVLKTSGLFPVREWDRRMRGDQFHNAPYGLPGDFRIQKHGYEYRSLPSWLQSPTTAFIAVCTSKLAILDPEITTSWKEKTPEATARNLLRGLAKLYKGRDDDAYILYHLLTRSGDAPFVFDYEADFAPSWGIPRDRGLTDDEAEMILPACIQPYPDEIAEMRNHLLMGIPLTFQTFPPNFQSAIPKSAGYKWLPLHVNPGRRSGFGDLLHNLVGHRDMDIYWDYNNAGEFKITGKLPALWAPSDKELLRRYYPHVFISSKGRDRENGTAITVPKPLCQAQTISGFRAILVNSGLFPLWTVESVQKDSMAKWLETKKKVAEARTWRTY